MNNLIGGRILTMGCHSYEQHFYKPFVNLTSKTMKNTYIFIPLGDNMD